MSSYHVVLSCISLQAMFAKRCSRPRCILFLVLASVFSILCYHFLLTSSPLERYSLLEFLGIETVSIDTENGKPVIIDIEYDDRIQMSTLSEIGVQMPSVPSRNEPPADRSFVYAMSFKDQMTNAIARIRSLQCWARQWNMFAVEPFVNDTFFRTPYHQPLSEILQHRFRHYFDFNVWNEVGTENGLPVLVDWEDFVANASREVIMVHMIYKIDHGCLQSLFTSPFRTCDSGMKFLRDMWSKFLAKERFSIAREVCIDMTQYTFIDAEKFNQYIFGHRKPPYTVMFNEWRGIATHSARTCYINTIASNCTFKGHYEIAIQSLVPNSDITDKAALYVSKYLSPDFTAIMVRWEKVIQYWGPQNGCLKMIKTYLNTHPPVNSTTVFLTSDAGKLGSQSFSLLNQKLVNASVGVQNHEELLHFVHGRPISIKEYDQTFEEVLGSSNPVFISRFQQAIASRAKCLILVGPDNGLFHRHTLVLHHRLHPNNQCYERFDNKCHSVMREAPWARGTAS